MAVHKKCLIGSIILGPIGAAVFVGVIFLGNMFLNWFATINEWIPLTLAGMFFIAISAGCGFIVYDICTDHHKENTIKKIKTHG